MSSYTLQNTHHIEDQAKILENIKTTESITKWVIFEVSSKHIELVQGNGAVIYDYINNGACQGCLVFADMDGTFRVIYNDKRTEIPNASTGVLLRSENNMDLEKVRELLTKYVSSVM